MQRRGRKSTGKAVSDDYISKLAKEYSAQITEAQDLEAKFKSRAFQLQWQAHLRALLSQLNSRRIRRHRPAILLEEASSYIKELESISKRLDRLVQKAARFDPDRSLGISLLVKTWHAFLGTKYDRKLARAVVLVSATTKGSPIRMILGTLKDRGVKRNAFFDRIVKEFESELSIRLTEAQSERLDEMIEPAYRDLSKPNRN